MTNAVVDMWRRLHDKGYFPNHNHYGGGELLNADDRFDRSLDGLVGLQSTDDVLDIGCGYGRLMHAIAGSVNSIVGVDVHNAPIRTASRLLSGFENAEVLVTDGVSLPFEDHSFDLVYSMSVFQHLSRKIVHGYFAEIGRVLRNDGRLLIQFSRKARADDVDPTRDREQSVQWLPSQLAALADLIPGAILMDIPTFLAVVRT
jgi:cyclopropane fatty-acyl-phospholipid synthase-like methyltransferase